VGGGERNKVYKEGAREIVRCHILPKRISTCRKKERLLQEGAAKAKKQQKEDIVTEVTEGSEKVAFLSLGERGRVYGR